MNNKIAKNLELLIKDAKLGKYVLPFKTDMGETEERESNVVYVSEFSRMLAIIEQLEDGSYLDWYYNELEEQFKPLTQNEGDEYYDLTFRESWMFEELADRLPEPFKSYIPKPRY